MRLFNTPTLALLLVAGMLAGCAHDHPYHDVPPPPSSWAGEGWARHVHRCERHYPHYDPHTDLVYRRSGNFACPL